MSIHIVQTYEISGVAKVYGALSEVGGLGPLASKFFSWGPLVVDP